jgi:hypothetical protein
MDEWALVDDGCQSIVLDGKEFRVRQLHGNADGGERWAAEARARIAGWTRIGQIMESAEAAKALVAPYLGVPALSPAF